MARTVLSVPVRCCLDTIVQATCSTDSPVRAVLLGHDCPSHAPVGTDADATRWGFQAVPLPDELRKAESA
ncbi:MAG: hypothetical protein NZ874_10360 [Fimbriimonadales bacterium]|nr:hypothetical protein [Fimbriimonadales bacterium]